MHYLEQLSSACKFIQSQSEIKPRIAITLGSGLSRFASHIQVEKTIAYQDIPHFTPPSVEGHPGSLILGSLEGVPLVLLQGRIHSYEGHSLEQVTFATRMIKLLGAELLILTNAAGGINPQMTPGSLLVIRDHINLTGRNPLVGPNISELGPRFPDMTEPYDRELSDRLVQICKQKKLNFFEGVYCGVLGPCYETAAEVKFLRQIGGDAVGMSTVPETIVARHMGLKTVGVSCITNLATGLSQHKVTHEEVKEVAARVEQEFADLLLEFIRKAY